MIPKVPALFGASESLEGPRKVLEVEFGRFITLHPHSLSTHKKLAGNPQATRGKLAGKASGNLQETGNLRDTHGKPTGPTGNLQETCRKHVGSKTYGKLAENPQEGNRNPAGNLQETCGKREGHRQETHRKQEIHEKPKGNLQGTRRKPTGNLQDVFRNVNPTGNLQEACATPLGNLQETYSAQCVISRRSTACRLAKTWSRIIHPQGTVETQA